MCLILGEEEKLSEIDSDDVIEEDEDSVNTSNVKSKKKVSNKRTKRKKGSQKKLKTMYNNLFSIVRNYLLQVNFLKFLTEKLILMKLLKKQKKKLITF